MLGVSKLSEIKQRFIKTGSLRLSMGPRLFLFLIVLVVTMLLGIIAILLLTGTFTAKLNTHEELIQNKLSFTWRNISNQYGQLSVESVDLATELSKSIEKRLQEQGLEVSDLQDHPELLEALIAGEYERALFSLQRSKSSGVFIILDATVNPKLKNAEASRAGLFIKNMEPNILSSSSPTIVLLRGFPNIGRSNTIPLHTQWSMEFDITNASYYRIPMEAASQQTLPLSRLYYWNPAITLPGTSEEVMLCSVPLIDSKGNVFGVCGFEVSAMLFKLSHLPDNRIYNRISCMLTPVSQNTFDVSQAMFSGGYSARNVFADNQLLHFKESQKKSFFSYREEGGDSFLGFHTSIELYPKGSAFSHEDWAVALMVPTEDIISSIANANYNLALKFVLLMILGIIVSFFLSKYYMRPIKKSFDMIKSNGLIETPKTEIPEIDDLIEFLSLENESFQKKGEEDPSSVVLNEFLKNLKTLSPAERSVFNLYVQQYTAKEIAAKLCLSINTIKTHNKRIYAKLNVTSRKELLVFINMLEEAGKKFHC
ncbi:LuxR family transcriptional regulator [Natronincola peptidivorans]|uniref:LuxR family transcriptional regulator n=1 Tax=Natronincola peptidivorans TaxID=426128 RepID=UPI00147D4A52|nr:LuxR family transcriptional regulator [Natronincola peptidivorans]